MERPRPENRTVTKPDESADRRPGYVNRNESEDEVSGEIRVMNYLKEKGLWPGSQESQK